jgi:hypothetical protein
MGLVLAVKHSNIHGHKSGALQNDALSHLLCAPTYSRSIRNDVIFATGVYASVARSLLLSNIRGLL